MLKYEDTSRRMPGKFLVAGVSQRQSLMHAGFANSNKSMRGVNDDTSWVIHHLNIWLLRQERGRSCLLPAWCLTGRISWKTGWAVGIGGKGWTESHWKEEGEMHENERMNVERDLRESSDRKVSNVSRYRRDASDDNNDECKEVDKKKKTREFRSNCLYAYSFLFWTKKKVTSFLPFSPRFVFKNDDGMTERPVDSVNFRLKKILSRQATQQKIQRDGQ